MFQAANGEVKMQTTINHVLVFLALVRLTALSLSLHCYHRPFASDDSPMPLLKLKTSLDVHATFRNRTLPP